MFYIFKKNETWKQMAMPQQTIKSTAGSQWFAPPYITGCTIQLLRQIPGQKLFHFDTFTNSIYIYIIHDSIYIYTHVYIYTYNIHTYGV